MHISLLDVAAALSDADLIQHVKRMVANERQATAQLVAHLAEMDARGGQCAFVGAAGRCTERGFLEYHHVIPFADGG